jgi:hypothetical protein
MPNRYSLVIAALVGVVSLAACQDKPQDVADLPSVPSAFPELLFPPGGVLQGRAGSEDALQLIFHSPAAPDELGRSYRGRLSAEPWKIVGDAQEGDVTTIYAERLGRPLWIRIAPAPEGGSRVELSGAVLVRDTTAVPPSPTADSAVADSSAAEPPSRPAAGTPATPR